MNVEEGGYTYVNLDELPGKPYETLAVLDSQPYQSFVDLYIGNWSFTRVPPQYFQGFEFERVADGAGKFMLRVFDKFWDEIEETLHLGFQNITFRYGHVTGRQSRMFIGMLTDYELEFTTSGVVLTANGTSTAVRQNIQKLSATVSNATPDEVVTQIANKMGWVIGRIDKSLPIQDHSGLYTKEAEVKTWNINNEQPVKYILREVAPRAIRETDGKGGYQFYLDDSTSPPTVNFHPIDIDPNVERTYVFHKGINTNVISFIPQFKGVFGAAGSGNATKVQTTAFDPTTKSEDELFHDISSNPNIDVTGDYTHTPQEMSTMTIDSTGMLKDELSAVLNYRWTNNFLQSYEASMEIIGDPTLEVTQSIRVIVLTDQGTLHHSSGIYLIKGIKDVIESGVMRTQLQLMRNADLSAGVEIVKYGIKKK